MKPLRSRAAAGVLLAAGCALFSAPLRAEGPAPIQVTLKDHRFAPAEIHVKAGAPALIELRNEDASAEEFDSDSLGVEKVIAGGRSGTVRLHALAPGRYPFRGEYHANTAQGVVIAE